MHALRSYTFRLPAMPPPFALARDPVIPWRQAAGRSHAPSAEPAATAARWVWHSRFGTIVIEVRGDDVFVNGDWVEPHAP